MQICSHSEQSEESPAHAGRTSQTNCEILRFAQDDTGGCRFLLILIFDFCLLN